jgi:hypothetical protein
MAKKTKTPKTEATTQPTTEAKAPAPVATTSEPATPAAPKATEIKPVETKETKETRNNIRTAKSTVDNPVQMVHQLVAEMKKANPQVTRKELMAACEAKGVAYYTARTQVQRALKAMSTAK